MRYNDELPVQSLWFMLTKALIEKHGALKAAGMLAGILSKHTYANYDLKRELHNRLENL